jgi:hypothetical protein
MEGTFPWRSWLGASVIFFLIFGVLNEGASWVDGLVSILLVSIPVFLGIIAGGIALVRGLPLGPAQG